jgi:conjugative relaxase-like TrwC/TraI family protein
MGTSARPGYSAEYLYGQVAVGRENYYLQATTAGEKAGVWWGEGARKFGLVGQVDHDVMKALYGEFRDPRDPRFADPATRSQSATLGRKPGVYKSADDHFEDLLQKEPPGEVLEERRVVLRGKAERMARQAVPYIDLTFSPVKSVTVLWTSYSRAEADAVRRGDEAARTVWAAKRIAVEQAVQDGNNAMLEHMVRRAGYSRKGRHGTPAGKWTEGHDWTVAQFFQTDSREKDPQVHIHNAVLNRVVCDDGEVRTLDSKAIHRNLRGAGTIGERVMEESLSRSLGVKWKMRKDGVAREVVGVDQRAMDLFSKRTKTIEPRVQKLVDEYRRKYNREPTALELDRMRRHATVSSRRAKQGATDGENADERLDRWDRELQREVAGGLLRVATTVGTGSDRTPAAEQWSERGVLEEAVAAMQAKRTSFLVSELERQIGLALPNHLGGLTDDQVTNLITGLAAKAAADPTLMVQVTGAQPTDEVPEELRVDNGSSVYLPPAAIRYSTPAHIAAEESLRRASVVRGRAAVDPQAMVEWMSTAEPAKTLGDDQRHAVLGLATSGAALSVLVGPAGAGKSWTVGTLSEAWKDLAGGRLVGVATSQIATEVLINEGVRAKNTTQWLDAQERLANGKGRGDDPEWALTDRDMVVVDEASMVTTETLERIRARVDAAGARLVLTGDPRQLPAVGAGGAMAMLADRTAETYTLVEIRRFVNPWEQDASLRLREGDDQAVFEYDRRGQIRDCGTADAAGRDASRAYLGDVLRGRSSLVVVPTNEQAAVISSQIRQKLVELGKVEPTGTILERDGNLVGVGDLVQARRNEWAKKVINRQRYTVKEILEDGALRVVGEENGREVVMPKAYVDQHMTLGYAATAHSAQGVTVDTSHAVITSAFTPEGQYVAMTRGREANTAHVATQPEQADEETGQTHQRERVSATAVMIGVMDREVDDQDAALVQAERDQEAALSARTALARVEDAVRILGRARLDTWVDRLTDQGLLPAGDRMALAKDMSTEQLSRLLRAAEQSGYDPEQVLRDAVTSSNLDGARSVARVLHGRITDTLCQRQTARLVPNPEAHPASDMEGIPQRWRPYLSELEERIDDRRRVLGAQVAQEQPKWAIDTLGPVPDEVVARAEWEHRAGIGAAYREAVEPPEGWEDEATAAGPSPDTGSLFGPSPGLTATEKRAAWREAWVALGQPESTREEEGLSVGALRLRVKAWERELEWQPPHVDAQLRATAMATAEHRQEAAILLAQAETTDDEAEQARLRTKAEGRNAMADRLAETEARLDEVAKQRVAWFKHTAATRQAAQRARVELAARDMDIGGEDDRVTAEEWLAAEAEARRADEEHRPVSEADVERAEQHALSMEVDDEQDSDVPAARAEVPEAAPVARVAEQEEPAEAAMPKAEEVTVPDAAQDVPDGDQDAAQDKLPRGVPDDKAVAAAAAAAEAAARELKAREDAYEQYRREYEEDLHDLEQARRDEAYRVELGRRERAAARIRAHEASASA